MSHTNFQHMLFILSYFKLLKPQHIFTTFI